MFQNNTRKHEIIRFVIIGLLATAIDYIFYSLTSFLLTTAGMESSSIWVTVICTTVGFTISVIVNYLLSVSFVFKYAMKVEKNKTSIHFLTFIVLALVGLFIGIGIMLAFKYSILPTGIDIDAWATPELQPGENWLVAILSTPTLYLFTLAFAVKTLLVMVFNYVSRKKLLFKEITNVENENSTV